MKQHKIILDFKADDEIAKEISERISKAIDDIYAECVPATEDVDVAVRTALFSLEQVLE